MEHTLLKIFVKATGNFITFSVNNALKLSSANLIEIFCWNWLVVISTASFTEHIFNRQWKQYYRDSTEKNFNRKFNRK